MVSQIQRPRSIEDVPLLITGDAVSTNRGWARSLVFPPEKTKVQVYLPSEEFHYQNRWRLLGNL